DFRDDMSEEEQNFLIVLISEAKIFTVICNALLGGNQLEAYAVKFFLQDAKDAIERSGESTGNADALWAQWLVANGEWAFAQQKYASAERFFTEAKHKARLAGHKLWAQISILNLAHALIKSGKTNQALHLLQNSLEDGFALETAYYEAKWDLAYCTFLEGQTEEATRILQCMDEELQERPELNTWHALALQPLGMILCETGDAATGKETLLKAQSLWTTVNGSENQQKRIADWPSFRAGHGL
ncbi:MAG: hypothetical protein D6732_10510, partial [Methanobacteriota archaeon]